MTGAANSTIQRRPFVADLLGHAGDAVILTGLGSTSWDCFAAGDRDRTLYSWGAMGLAAPTALGLALARPDERVVVITGDGEMMMGIGSLAVIAAEAPANLAVVVLDNEHFGETGRQSGLTARGADLVAIARGAGFEKTRAVTEASEAEGLASFVFEEPGPVFVSVKIALSDDPLTLPEQDGAILANRLRAALGAG